MESYTLVLTSAEAEFLATVIGDTRDRAARLVSSSPSRVTRHAKAYEVQMATALLERLPAVGVDTPVQSGAGPVAMEVVAEVQIAPPVTGPTAGPVNMEAAPVTPGTLPPAPWEQREGGFPVRKTK